jgi:hypothetical protein
MKNVDTRKERSAGERGEKIAMPDRMKSEKGVALIMVLVMSAVVLAIMTALLYMVTSGTQISGFQKRYKTALEAAKGGSDAFYQVIAAGDTSTLTGLSPSLNVSSSCSGTAVLSGATYTTGFAAKLKVDSSNWSTGCTKSLTIDPKDSATYDMKLPVGNYTYYAKIVNTIEGNSAGGSTGLYTGSVITGGTGGGGGSSSIAVVSMPYLYTIEVDTENSSNPAERAKLSILYEN